MQYGERGDVALQRQARFEDRCMHGLKFILRETSVLDRTRSLQETDSPFVEWCRDFDSDTVGVGHDKRMRRVAGGESHGHNPTFNQRETRRLK